MERRLPGQLTAAGMLMLASAGCSITSLNPPTKAAAAFVGAQFVPEGKRVTAPFAQVLFCDKVPGECAAAEKPVAVAFSLTAMAQMATVNREVNDFITPRPDPGLDTWSLFPQAGDCEDYALTKRHILVAQGWPASALRLAIGETDEKGHLVLVARTTRGDFVLDNRSDGVTPWASFDMQWLSVSSSTDPHVWHQVPQSSNAQLLSASL